MKEEERFWSKVKIATPDECWEWQDFCDKFGYGPPGPDRWKVRSTTFPGFAAAMALQWG